MSVNARNAPTVMGKEQHVVEARGWALWRQYFRIVLNNVTPILLLVLIWQLVAQLELLSPKLFPSPWTAIQAIERLVERGIFFKDVYVSLRRLLISVMLAVPLGTLLGLIIGTVKGVERLLHPPLQFVIAIPGIALFPLAILWFGLTEKAIIVTLALLTSIEIAFNTWTGVKSVEEPLIWAARSMGVTKVGLFSKVLIPAALPFIITGYRLGISRAWRILIAGEMIASTQYGVGVRIFIAQQFFATDIVYGGLLIVGLLGFLLERVILRSMETFTVERWGMVREM